MNRDEVQILIDSHGADAVRWPLDLRAGAEAAIATDPELQAQHADAAALDGLLDSWARRLPAAADTAAIAASIMRPARWPRAAGFGGLAAAAVAALILVSPPSLAPPPTIAITTPADDAAAFATIFTPTPDEENLI